jgi:hypothetical protein
MELPVLAEPKIIYFKESSGSTQDCLLKRLIFITIGSFLNLVTIFNIPNKLNVYLTNIDTLELKWVTPPESSVLKYSS